MSVRSSSAGGAGAVGGGSVVGVAEFGGLDGGALDGGTVEEPAAVDVDVDVEVDGPDGCVGSVGALDDGTVEVSTVEVGTVGIDSSPLDAFSGRVHAVNRTATTRAPPSVVRHIAATLLNALSAPRPVPGVRRLVGSVTDDGHEVGSTGGRTRPCRRSRR